MKKIIFFTSLILSYNCLAQKQEVQEEKVKARMYIGLGVQIQSDLNINSKLGSSGLPKINQALPEFSVGANMVGKKYSGDIELGTAISNTEANSVRNEYLGVTGRLRFHYNLKAKENMLFTVGGNIAYSGNSLNIFSTNNIIDMNNLVNNTNVNHLNLRNNMFYIGPSVSIYTLRKASFPLRLNIAYEIALTRGRWRSDYTAVSNTVGEFAKNRIVISFNIL